MINVVESSNIQVEEWLETANQYEIDEAIEKGESWVDNAPDDTLEQCQALNDVITRIQMLYDALEDMEIWQKDRENEEE